MVLVPGVRVSESRRSEEKWMRAWRNHRELRRGETSVARCVSVRSPAVSLPVGQDVAAPDDVLSRVQPRLCPQLPFQLR